MYKVTHKNSFLTFGLVVFSLLSGLVLSSTYASADDPVIDEVNVTVPISCTLSGTGMDSHITELHNTESDSTIGETIMKAYCNDNNGFSIYAIGFTDDEYGKNVLTDSNLGSTHDIPTGTSTTGNTSQWAMKLSTITSPTPTYPLIIAGSEDDTSRQQGDLDYTAFQAVPSVYTLVAKRESRTDIGEQAEGSTLKSTYQAYISPTQNAGTYEGQVKYTLVHPYDRYAPEPPYFNVYYTGRPASTTPGEENPVKIRMSELPADGKYNLLGTEDGLYDKLTPDTYYGGYYKNVVDSPENFTYTNESDVYDGTNFNWLVSTPETTDAAAITPEDEATYYVKEVNSDRFLRWTIRWTSSVGKILTMWFMTDLDDDNYYTAGFDVTINNGALITYPINEGFYYSYKIIPKNNPNNSSTVTAASIFSVYGDNNQLGVWRDFDNEILNNEVETFTLNPFWVTKDGYKVNGRRKRNQVANGWNENLFNGETERIPISIIKWQEPNP